MSGFCYLLGNCTKKWKTVYIASGKAAVGIIKSTPAWENVSEIPHSVKTAISKWFSG